jgi:hypothetical protein
VGATDYRRGLMRIGRIYRISQNLFVNKNL